MDNKDDLSKLSKKELIRVINSYKEKLVSLEEYMNLVKPSIANF